MEVQIYIKAVLRLKKQVEIYREINQQIHSATNNRDDFCCRISCIDSYLETAIVDCLDDALLYLTGFHELASYYLYEGDKYGWLIKTLCGKTYTWKNGEEFEKVVIEMAKENQND